MAFLAHISMKPETNALKVSILQKANPIKEKIHFCYYRLAKGIAGILAYAKVLLQCTEAQADSAYPLESFFSATSSIKFVTNAFN